MSADDPLLTTSEVARWLNVHEKTVYRWARLGVLTSVRIVGALRFKREEIEAAITAGYTPRRTS